MMNRRGGFSVLEVLIVIAIGVSLIFVIGKLNDNIGLLNNLVSQQLQSKSDISQTLQIITTEIRSAAPSAAGAYPIESASTSSFAYFSDINKDGTVEHIRYFLASSTIYKGVIYPTGSPALYPTSTETLTDLIDSVVVSTSTPLFQYYDANYSGTSSPMTYPILISSIRLISISFGADIKPNVAPGPTNFSTLINIRNLRSN